MQTTGSRSTTIVEIVHIVEQKLPTPLRTHFEGGSTDPSTLAFQGINWPTAVACGDPYSIYGTVSSNYPIHYVGVYIYDLDGNEVQSKVVKPNAGSYDIHQIDNDIKFGSLPSGTYIFQVEATDDSDRFIWSNCEFVIYNDLGDDLYGVLINTACWKPIAPNSDGNVELQTETGAKINIGAFPETTTGAIPYFCCRWEGLDADASGGSDGTNVQVWGKKRRSQPEMVVFFHSKRVRDPTCLLQPCTGLNEQLQ